MPPKVKTDREAILQAAFQVASVDGIAAITAQSVSKVLKTSVAPIFRVFQTVEELRMATLEKIDEFHTEYIKSYSIVNSEFLTYGLAYIHFAKEYPRLFETIMLPCSTDIDERMTGSLAFAVNSAKALSGLDVETGKAFFLNMWIYTHGIAGLVYKGSLILSEEDEKKLLETAYDAFYENCKQKKRER